MSKKPPIAHLPFNAELGPSLGSGQDNKVYALLGEGEKPHLRPVLPNVVKISHTKRERNRDPDPKEATWKGILYKKNKYEMLKMFLGDYVPTSYFVRGKAVLKGREQYTEYTFQRRVPEGSMDLRELQLRQRDHPEGMHLGALTDEQKQDPRLKGQLVDLMGKLRYMYQVMGEVNARTSNGITPLDGKLDLGGVSDYVRAETFDHDFTEGDADKIIQENSSPNLMVDPATMQLYCVDFDQGQWTEGMTEAKQLAEQIVARGVQHADGVGRTAVTGVLSQPS